MLDAEFWPTNSTKRYAIAISSIGRRGRWKFFWRTYAIFAESLDDFINDYRLAWTLNKNNDRELILFVDNDWRMEIPCPHTMDDKALVQHIRVFHNLARARAGIFEFIGGKSSWRVDVVEVCNWQPASKLPCQG